MAPTLKEKAESALKSNPSALGDPVSLKAETSSSTHDLKQQPPTEKHKQVKSSEGSKQTGKKSLKEVAKDSNPSLLGDPISLKAEKTDDKRDPDEGGKRKSKL